jgi:D-glycero-alpha-D-manno-heptose-7-phosphate kinase
VSAPATVCRRAPTRIDFGGGWTDVPPYSDHEGGYVCNVAIARYASVTIEPRPTGEPLAIATAHGTDQALARAAARRGGIAAARITLHNDFPLGAGLGGSSAAGVALAAAIAASVGERLDGAQLAERSRETECADLGIAGGRQDHYAAAFGGALGLRFGGGVEVTRLPLSERVRAELESRCILVYTGESRISGDTITAVLDAYRQREPRVLFALARMKALAEQMADALRHGDVDALAAFVGEHWAHQRALHPAIPTARIDAIIERGHDAGAAGAKALGASGGGCVLVIARSDTVDAVRDAVAPLGTLLEYRLDEHGAAPCP